VPGDRLFRILARLTDTGDPELGAPLLCQVCAEVTMMSGAGIMLMSEDIPGGSVCTSNAVSAVIEELQYTLGEGPCVDAHLTERPTFEPDLADPATVRWTAFTPPAVAAGARAVFGFPLRVGAIRLGALNLYRNRPGGLDDDQHADALVLADVAARSVLAMQAQAAPGSLAEELRGSANLQSVVHQASGMISAQLEVSVTEAFVRLRAYAFASGRSLTEIAADVVGRRLRFDRLPDDRGSEK
jgi:hypothetical protein